MEGIHIDTGIMGKKILEHFPCDSTYSVSIRPPQLRYFWCCIASNSLWQYTTVTAHQPSLVTAFVDFIGEVI